MKSPLTLPEDDYRNLAARWIPRELADAAKLQRVDSATGREMVGRRKGDFAGIAIPYILPGQTAIREYRIRRDHPDLELHRDGSVKERAKYVSPPSRGNLLYFPLMTPPAFLRKTEIPIVLTAGEFKTLALWRLANHDSETSRFLPVGLAGVWNWRGVVAKTTGANGECRGVKGVIPDLDLIQWKGRPVIIVFDSDAGGNESVQAARSALARELRCRGAKVTYLDWNPALGKGIDDHIAAVGPEQVLAEITTAIESKGKSKPCTRSNGSGGQVVIAESEPNLVVGYDPEDVRNAQRLVAMYGEDLRYCHAFRKWFFWDGLHWKVNDVDHARVLARKMMTAFAMQALKANADEKVIKFAAGCRRTARITDCLREAEPLRPITPADLDTHPFLLNFVNGTFDIHTGELMPHKREHFISKLVYHKYNPQAQCPLFLRFLNRIMGCYPDASLGEPERADRLEVIS